MDQRCGLVGDRLHQPGVRMAEGVHRHPGDRIEITFAGFIPQVGAFAAHKGDGLAGIGIHQVFGHGSKLYLCKGGNKSKAIRRPEPPYPFAILLRSRFLGYQKPCTPAPMKNSMGMESSVLVREARKATRRALFFCSSEAGVMPRIFFWVGQISAQTLNSMMVPSHAPMPISAVSA